MANQPGAAVVMLAVVMVPSGLWIFEQAELYAKRKGKLARSG